MKGVCVGGTLKPGSSLLTTGKVNRVKYQQVEGVGGGCGGSFYSGGGDMQAGKQAGKEEKE